MLGEVGGLTHVEQIAVEKLILVELALVKARVFQP
jgi:hypothetical protein